MHEMIRIDGVWECLSCPRRLVFGEDKLPVALEHGENVSHFGTVDDAPRLLTERRT